MDVLQIITVAGVALITAAAIASYLYSRKQNLKVEEENLKSVTAQVAQYLETPYSEAITKDVLDQIVKKAKVLPQDVTIDLGKLDQTAKPKKKRKYYPKKPKTQL
jgi:hypothetical protein